MGKLQDYYRLFDMLKENLSDEQKSMFEGLENQLIEEELLPVISDSVSSVLCDLRQPLSLTIDYNPETGITVKRASSEISGKSTEAESVSSLKPKPGLCVWISTDEFIQEKNATQTMVRAIEIAGPKRVADLAIQHDKDLLVTKTTHPLYSKYQHTLSDGHLLNTHSNNEGKKKQLEKISTALSLGWKVEII